MIIFILFREIKTFQTRKSKKNRAKETSLGIFFYLLLDSEKHMFNERQFITRYTTERLIH
jgi:hypothetical protein